MIRHLSVSTQLHAVISNTEFHRSMRYLILIQLKHLMMNNGLPLPMNRILNSAHSISQTGKTAMISTVLLILWLTSFRIQSRVPKKVRWEHTPI